MIRKLLKASHYMKKTFLIVVLRIVFSLCNTESFSAHGYITLRFRCSNDFEIEVVLCKG